MPDIAHTLGLPRIRAVVEAFYAEVRRHPRLALPFGRVDDWPRHLDQLTHFWWTTLGGERYLDYRYHVAARHAGTGFTPALLQDWLALFEHTLRANLPAELAEPWLERARRIGESLRLMHELGHFDRHEALSEGQPTKPPLQCGSTGQSPTA